MMPELRELRGLELDRPELDRQEGAVHLRADAGQARQQQQRDRRRRDRVAVALEHVVVAQEQDRARRRTARPDHEPLRLLARQLGVDPVDQHEPDRRRAAAASGNRYGSASGRRARMNRCATTQRPRKTAP